MTLSALLFDVDGTLFDTKKLRTQAFQTAFQSCGYNVALDRILPEIGKGGDHLIPDLLGESAGEKDGEKIKEIYGEEFLKRVEAKPVKVFNRVLDLLTELKKRGFLTAIATSADKKYFEAICKSAGINLKSHVDLVITADDAKNSKPAPDILEVTCQKLKVSVAECAEVVCIGVLSGGNDEKVLRSAGARRAYKDVAEILKKLDEMLEIASPGESKITDTLQKKLMCEALKTARDGAAYVKQLLEATKEV